MKNEKVLSKRIQLPIIPFFMVVGVLAISIVILILVVLHTLRPKIIVQDNANVLSRNSAVLPKRVDYVLPNKDDSAGSSNMNVNSVIPKPMKIGDSIFGNLTNISKLNLIVSTPSKSNSKLTDINENACVLTYHSKDMGNSKLIIGKSTQQIQSSDIYELPKLVDSQICQVIKDYYKISSSDNITLSNGIIKKIDWTEIPFAYVSTNIMKNSLILVKDAKIAYFNNIVDGNIDFLCSIPDYSKLTNANQMFFGELDDIKTVVMQPMGE